MTTSSQASPRLSPAVAVDPAVVGDGGSDVNVDNVHVEESGGSDIGDDKESEFTVDDDGSGGGDDDGGEAIGGGGGSGAVHVSREQLVAFYQHHDPNKVPQVCTAIMLLACHPCCSSTFIALKVDEFSL